MEKYCARDSGSQIRWTQKKTVSAAERAISTALNPETNSNNRHGSSALRETSFSHGWIQNDGNTGDQLPQRTLPQSQGQSLRPQSQWGFRIQTTWGTEDEEARKCQYLPGNPDSTHVPLESNPWHRLLGRTGRVITCRGEETSKYHERPNFLTPSNDAR